MKRNFIQQYNAAEHAYFFTLDTIDGMFTGRCVCHPEDYDKESELFGYNLAETRAKIAWKKYVLAREKAEYRILENFYKSLKCYADFNDNSIEAKKIRRQLFIKERHIKACQGYIDYKKNAIKNQIKSLSKFKKVKSN